ncbi:4-amino-4-deoxy-L-arabinose transferase [Frateuria sp. Soil773]|uniref:ArnT family glycosyltransferase n=1 Tax=Frateuria sp. Soil773 TaxID=1736407 RepID=UPI0006FEB695|nr:glycosyltransferase family 39 protein [Frateuria sp. Soil773]KRE93802.1 4-amino-4-deoxy-L-arabinose transferase [Frateuria sp. Soil773]
MVPWQWTQAARCGDRTSVAAGLARWRAAFVILFAALLLAKLAIACTLSPFGDEAFYWQESRRLAWGYSDLPPLTAWLIRLGESVAGHGLFGMRWPFLLLGSALPWLVVALARHAFDARAGWQAGLLCLLLPLAGTLGVLALPDVPLTVAILLALYALLRAMAEDRAWQWWLLGLALAACWVTHYRAAMPMLVGLLLFALTPRGRAQWRRGGFWLAMALASLGLVPLAVSNWQQRGAGVAFQLVERNPWRFHADALVQPLEQALACTPLLYALLLWAAWRCWKRRSEGAPWDVFAVASLGFIVLYFLLGLFADDLRFRAHWPLPGYLPLLAALPALWRGTPRGWRRFVAAAGGLAALGLALGLGYLALAASSQGAGLLANAKAFPGNFVGWRESAAAARELLERQPAVLVADNFMLAAELDFALDRGQPVYALDNPLNVKHGRAPQLAIWRYDEAGLRAAHASQPVLLAVDEGALRERERAAWLGSVCARIADLRPVRRLSLFGGRKRIAFYRGTVPPSALSPGAPAASCLVWRQAHAAQYGGG